MNPQDTVKSILAADFGAANTRAILIDLVDGQYRLVASAKSRTTIAPPFNDVSVGLIWAISQIEAATHRQLFDDDGLLIPEVNGNGIDRLVITSSAARPLTAVLLGLMPNVSINSAMRALTGTYINVATTLSIGDQRDEEKQINQMLRVNPDLIFVSGGTDGGNEETVLRMARLAALAAQLAPEEQQPIVLYAGNSDLTEQVNAIFEASGVRLLVSPNVRPSLMKEELGNARIELARAFGDHIARQPGGFEPLAEVGITPTAQGVSNVIRWLSERYERVPMHIDVGSSTSTLVYGYQNDVIANIYSDLGLGQSLLATIERIGFDNVADWLPFEISEAALLNYAHNKALRSDLVPQSIGDLMVEFAVLRMIMRTLLEEAREAAERSAYGPLMSPSPLLISGSSLTDGLHPGIAIMLVMDAFEVFGMIDVYADPYGVVPAVGTIAYFDPTIAVQVYDNHGVNFLGTVFAPVGQTRGNAMKIKVTFDDGIVHQQDIASGDIISLPGRVGQSAEVNIRMSRGLTLDGKRRIKRKVRVGAAGIIFDARGRPLNDIPLEKRAATYERWWRAVTHGQLVLVAPAEYEMDANADDLKQRLRETDGLKNTIRKAILEAEQREEVFGEVLNERPGGRGRGRQQRRRREIADLDELIDQI